MRILAWRIEGPRTDGLIPPFRYPVHGHSDGLPIDVRIQLARAARLLRRPREVAQGRASEKPGGDARLDEEHLPPHPLGPRWMVERDRAGSLRGSGHAREGLRRGPVDGAAPRLHGEDHRQGGPISPET